MIKLSPETQKALEKLQKDPEFIELSKKAEEAIKEFAKKERERYQIVGEPGPWCKKLQDWIDAQEDLVDIKFDFADGEHDIEKVAEQAYKIFTGEYPSVDITDEDL